MTIKTSGLRDSKDNVFGQFNRVFPFCVASENERNHIQAGGLKWSRGVETGSRYEECLGIIYNIYRCYDKCYLAVEFQKMTEKFKN